MAAYPPPTIVIFPSVNYNTDFFIPADEEGVLSGYVKKTGSTMTGQLKITTNSLDSPLRVKNLNTSTAAGTICEADTGVITAFAQGCSAAPNYAANNGYIKTINSLAIATGPNNPGANTIPTMVVHSNQNVGIGVSNPSYKLDVNGVIYSSSTITANGGMAAASISGGTISTTGAFINSNTTIGNPTTGTNGGTGDRLIVDVGASGVYPHSIGISADSSMWYSTPSSAGHNFYTGGTSKMVIASNGKIGIGTAPGAFMFDIYCGGASAEGLRVQNGANTGSVILSSLSSKPGFIQFIKSDGTRAGYIGYENVANYLDLVVEGSFLGYRNTGNFLVNNRVGIGNENPQTSLDIYNATNPKIFLNQAGTTRCFLSANLFGIDIGNDVGTGKRVRFMPDNVQRVVMDDLGYTYIGMSPVTNLFGIRISGSDFVNTIYQDNVAGANIGITCGDSNASINLNHGNGWTTVATKRENQIVVRNYEITPTFLGTSGYWMIMITPYRIANQWNTIFFSCSTNVGANVGYWSGTIVINGVANNVVSVSTSASNLFISWNWSPPTMYILVTSTGTLNVTSGAVLYYKCIG